MRKLARAVALCLALVLIVYLLLRTGVLTLPREVDPFAPIDLAATPNFLTEPKLTLMAGDFPACVAALRNVNVPVRVMPPRQEGPGCERRDTIEIAKLSHASFEPLELRCDLALRLYLFERHAAQPAAQRFFGRGIERIEHFGTIPAAIFVGEGAPAATRDRQCRRSRGV